MKNIRGRGFTLIEILIVLGIIAALSAIAIVAINPAKQFAQARQAQRQAGVTAILNAIGQRMADNKGIFEGDGCPALTSATSSISTGDLDLGDDCLVPEYIAALPTDPTATGGDTGYTVSVQASERVLVCAPNAADEPAIPDSEAICVLR